MAVAGTTSSAAASTTRTTLNVTGVNPSRYAHESNGTNVASSAGSATAATPIVTSNVAYARRRATAGREDRRCRTASNRPPSHDPSARPPMKAASTVLAAATVWPI
jgi:hypothetical protein